MTQAEINQKFKIIAIEEGLLPIKVTAFYKKKIDLEIATLCSHLGPLHRISFPTKERLDLRAPNEVKDFVDDRSNATGYINKTFMIRKYEERMLFLPTSDCVANCQYCFRTDVLSENNAIESPGKLGDEISQLCSYLKANPEISELILSGGDPLVLPVSKLKEIFERVSSVSSVKNIRIHTKAIVYGPNSFTQEKIDLFAKYNVRLVFHIVHPYEICDEVTEKIKELRNHNIRLYNQFPLLRNTNDHPLVLYTLLEKLDNLNVRNLSIYIPDPINFSAAFRVRLHRVWRIADQLRKH